MILPWQPFILMIANRMRDGLVTELTADPLNPQAPSSTSKFKAAIWHFFTDHGQQGRLLLWALPFAIMLISVCHWHVPWYENALYFVWLWLFAFLGACWADWGEVYLPPWTLPRCARLAWQGIKFTLPAAVIAALGDFPHNIVFGALVALGGVLIVPSYMIGWIVPSHTKGIENGTPLGSALFGFFLGLIGFFGFMCR